MSKEMTEIAELTSEIEVANKRVLFNYLTKDIENWKMPRHLPLEDAFRCNDSSRYLCKV